MQCAVQYLLVPLTDKRGNKSMSEQVVESSPKNAHTAYSSAVFNMITKELSGRAGELVEGTFLHFMPILMLTEYQAERFYWAELRKMISASVYLNGEKLNLDLRLVRPFPNRMLVAITHKNGVSGLYIPTGVDGVDGVYEIQVDWVIAHCNGEPSEQVTHIQKVIIKSDAHRHQPLTIYSIPEMSCQAEGKAVKNLGNPLGLKTYANSEGFVTRQRANAFGTLVECERGITTYSEAVTITEPLEIDGAAFFVPLLDRFV